MFPSILKIGPLKFSSPVVLAPMAGVTDFPFRRIVHSFGDCLAFSEMTASRAVVESLRHPSIRKRMRFFDNTKEHIAVQLVGYDPDIMAQAAAWSEQMGALFIDINMGCPVKKVVHTDAGAALMKDENLAAQIMQSVVKAVSIPVTVKFRLGWDKDHLNAVKMASIAQDSGIQGVTVHARTRAQFYEGKADWAALRPIKQVLRNIPLIGNGDVQTGQDAADLLRISGADAVMVGRGTWGRPWAIHHIAHFLQTGKALSIPRPYEILKIMQNHFEKILEEYGPEKGTLLARQHIGWYSKGFPGSAEFRAKINTLRSVNDIKSLMNHFFDSLEHPAENLNSF